MSANKRNLRWLISLPVVVLLIGTIGFMILEKLAFMDAVYFTIVTISTVGYGDILPTTTASKAFSIFLIVIGIGVFLTIITSVAEMLFQRSQDKVRRQRLHMIIGVFFTEVGNTLLHLFAEYDPDIEKVREDLTAKEGWNMLDLVRLRSNLDKHEFSIDPATMELDTLRDFLRPRSELLLRQIENTDLMEHESFTELLWAIVHLRDELLFRKSLENLPETDMAHLAGDARRAYIHLVRQWVDYLEYLKGSYPFLYSLALRTNPFVKEPQVIIQ